MEIHEFDDPTASATHDMYVSGSDSGMDGSYGSDVTVDDTDHGSTGTTDSTDTDDSGATLTLEVDGESYEYEATTDSDGDGDPDTAIVGTGDGKQVILGDTDGDGTVDHAALTDESGNVIDTAVYDEESGEWNAGDDSDYSEPDDTTTTTGSDDTSYGGSDDDQGGLDTPGSGSPEEITVAGLPNSVTATIDTDGDGSGDTAVIEGEDGTRVAVTDTDGDHEADTAGLLDESGQVIETAHVDPATGQWVEGLGDTNPYEGYEALPTDSDSSVNTTSTSSVGDDVTDAPEGASRDILVEAGGQSNELEATIDVDRDGVSETAVVNGADGTQIAFSDTDGDGAADRAAVFDPSGNLVGTAHFDPASGDWVDDAGSSAL